MKRKVEFIESYIKVGNDYQWNDNHGELIRCKDCKHRLPDENGNARICNHPKNNAWNISDMHYCGYAERRGEKE